MDEEVGVSVSEEEMIDSLFYRCDTLGEGKVHIYTVIQFLKDCLGNGNVSSKFFLFIHFIDMVSDAWYYFVSVVLWPVGEHHLGLEHDIMSSSFGFESI